MGQRGRGVRQISTDEGSFQFSVSGILGEVGE